MTIKNYILPAVICFVITTSVFGQAKQIGSEDYYQPLRDSYKKQDKVSRRQITSKERFENGKLSETTEITDEYLKPDKRHYLEIEKSADGIKKKEYFQVGKTFYCRENDGKWKQSKSWCEGDVYSGLSNVTSKNFTVEEAKEDNRIVKLYTSYYTFNITYPASKDNGKTGYSQSKYWLDDKGLVLREESTYGLVEPSRIDSKQTDSYEYNPKNLKITAPVK